MRGLDDATSELGLRGLSPEALVPPEIWAAMQAEIAQDRDDPEALAAVEKKNQGASLERRGNPVLFESVCIEMFEVAAPFRIILCRFQAILGKDAVNLVIRHLVPPAFSIEGASRSSAAAERRRGIFPHNKTLFDVAPEIAPRGNV
jgi:hypothetical protein